jgi:hypothetical protein
MKKRKTNRKNKNKKTKKTKTNNLRMGILLIHCHEFSFQRGKRSLSSSRCLSSNSVTSTAVKTLSSPTSLGETILLKAVKPLQKALDLIPIERIDSQN